MNRINEANESFVIKLGGCKGSTHKMAVSGLKK